MGYLRSILVDLSVGTRFSVAADGVLEGWSERVRGWGQGGVVGTYHVPSRASVWCPLSRLPCYQVTRVAIVGRGGPSIGSRMGDESKGRKDKGRGRS